MNPEHPVEIAPATRTKIYLACLVVNVLAILVVGLGVIFGLMDGVKGYAVVGVFVNAIGVMSNALALGYRPTRGNTEPDDIVVGVR